MVDQNTAQEFGHQIGAELALVGSITDIVQNAGNIRDVYYKFTLSLKNLRTGILEWSDEKEIRKIGVKDSFGW